MVATVTTLGPWAPYLAVILAALLNAVGFVLVALGTLAYRKVSKIERSIHEMGTSIFRNDERIDQLEMMHPRERNHAHRRRDDRG